jgi:5'-nucleotidase/UDP-sugar diphosphatase
MKSILIMTLVVVLLSVAPGAGAQGGDFTLTIVHTNDTHARIAQFSQTGGACSADDAAAGSCFGGVARRITAINRVRAEGVPMILVDAGDQFQGTLFYTQYKGQESVPFLNAMGYQAMAVGNHEFDDGPAVLARFIKALDFPVLSANIDASREPQLAGMIAPYAVLEAGGEQIGVVGYITEETGILSKPGPNITFTPIEAALKAAINALQAKGINKIVALSHAGILRDNQVAAALDGIDVIVGGHSHTLLSNTDASAYGPYPVVVKSPAGEPVLIVQDFWMGKFLGRLDVTFDAAGVATAWQGNPILLDAGVPQDATVLAEVQDLAAPLAAITGKVVGSSAVNLDGERTSCRFAECTLGNLITNAMLASTVSAGVQIAMENSGSIRASIPAGPVTLGQVLEVLPFGNMLATFDLKGSDLLAALEHSVSRAENTENEGTGRFQQVAGLRYTWNAAQPVGARIVNAVVRKTDGAYVPLDVNATYRIATIDFTRQGGDGFDMFAQKAMNAYDYGDPLDQVLADYIAANSPVTARIEGRISRIDTTTKSTAVTATTAVTDTDTITATTAAPLPATGVAGNTAGLLLALLVAGIAVTLASAGLVVRRTSR